MKLRHSILALLLFTQWSMVNDQWSMIRAQENDEVGIWSEIGVEKSITKKWNVGLDLEYRAQNRSRFSAGLSTSYKPWKWLKFGIGYNYLHSYRPDKYKEKNTKEEDPDNYSIGYNLTPELQAMGMAQGFTTRALPADILQRKECRQIQVPSGLYDTNGPGISSRQSRRPMGSHQLG